MADGSNSGGNGGLYFIVGALVVAVGVGAFALFGGHFGGTSRSSVTEQTTTSAPAPGASTTTTTTTTKKSN